MADHAKILLLGKTGVGKSSFVNYFLGEEVARTGAGEPVTQEYFVPYIYSGGRYPIEVVDTRGLEALGAAKQKEEIIREIQRRNNSENVYDWFHTIFYCVSLDMPRFEDFEAGFLRNLRSDLSQHIHIIMTHCDSKPAEAKDAMRQRIREALPDMPDLEIFEVTSVEKRKRSGTVHPSGREKISGRVFHLLVTDIADRLADEYAGYVHRLQEQTVREKFAGYRKVLDRETNPLRLIGSTEDLERKFRKVSREMRRNVEAATREADERLERVLRPACILYHQYWSTVHAEQLPDHVERELADLYGKCKDAAPDRNSLTKSLMPGVVSGSLPEVKSLWDMFGNLLRGVWDVLTFRQNARKTLSRIESQYLAQFPTEEEIRNRTRESIISYIEDGMADASF